MKPTYQGFEETNSSPFVNLPPVGSYVAKIMAARVKDASPKFPRDTLEVIVEITEGEYKGRYTEVYNDQKNRFGADNVKYKGVITLVPPLDDDEEWRKRTFQRAMWCVAQSNNGFHWDWDESKLVGHTVGISVRKRLYTYEGEDRETTEIGQFEVAQDVRDGKVGIMKPRDQRKMISESTVPAGYTSVEEKPPWD